MALKALSFNLAEAHFVAFPSQGNIYGLAVMHMESSACKILAASLGKPVVCFEYLPGKPPELLNPSSKEVQFTYIPGGTQIISIDCFNKSLYHNEIIVGITFSKEKEGKIPTSQYLNIYVADCEPNAEFNVDSIAQSCRSLELQFIPYKLFHAELWQSNKREIVFLLSGSDANVHLYKEDLTHTYDEHPVASYFPEFVDLPSISMSADIMYFDDHKKRLTAIGCENGYIRVILTDVTTNKIISTWEIEHDSIITSVHFFTLRNYIERPSFLLSAANDSGESAEDSSDSLTCDEPEIHLLVASALELAVVYCDVLREGFNEQKVLPNSDGFDCVQCACVADIDMDGTNELLLGTYGQELLTYKFVKEESNVQGTSTQTDKEAAQTGGGHQLQHGDFSLVWQRSFSYPLLTMRYADVTGDGMSELIILSTKGLHVLQHELEEVMTLLTSRLERLVRNLDKGDAFKELQSEDVSS